MTTVVIVDEAQQHLETIVDWWTGHRPEAPDLVIEELETCIRLLETTPDAGSRFRRTRVPRVRRLIMTRTRHLLYYVHDPENAVVYVIAVWGAPKHGDPPLRDPLR